MRRPEPGAASAWPLHPSQRLQEVPEALQQALDARAAEHAQLQQLLDQWMQALRPEMERMARDVLLRSAQTQSRQHETGGFLP